MATAEMGAFVGQQRAALVRVQRGEHAAGDRDAPTASGQGEGHRLLAGQHDHAGFRAVRVQFAVQRPRPAAVAQRHADPGEDDQGEQAATDDGECAVDVGFQAQVGGGVVAEVGDRGDQREPAERLDHQRRRAATGEDEPAQHQQPAREPRGQPSGRRPRQRPGGQGKQQRHQEVRAHPSLSRKSLRSSCSSDLDRFETNLASTLRRSGSSSRTLRILRAASPGSSSTGR